MTEPTEKLSRLHLTPMEAVNALYSEEDEDAAEVIVAGLGRQIFDSEAPEPSGNLKRRAASVMVRVFRRTSRTETRTDAQGREFVAFRNRLLEMSQHPFARTLLEPSSAHTTDFVEGGDPMNAPYMMLCPEIRENAGTWDRLLLDSVQGRDVQLRFLRETEFAYEHAKERLDRGEPVRLKAAAAGTGLSMILVFDRLIKEGHDPKRITATITDRDEGNVVKCRRLLGKLKTTREHLAEDGRGAGISARVRDLLVHFGASCGDTSLRDEGLYDVVTLVGILEYFRGHTRISSEERLRLDPIPPDKPGAVEVLERIGEMTAESGLLIANSYRDEPGARIIEVFGKRLFFRHREEMAALMATAGFVPTGKVGSGNVYDVEVFRKASLVG